MSSLTTMGKPVGTQIVLKIDKNNSKKTYPEVHSVKIRPNRPKNIDYRGLSGLSYEDTALHEKVNRLEPCPPFCCANMKRVTIGLLMIFLCWDGASYLCERMQIKQLGIMAVYQDRLYKLMRETQKNKMTEVDFEKLMAKFSSLKNLETYTKYMYPPSIVWSFIIITGIMNLTKIILVMDLVFRGFEIAGNVGIYFYCMRFHNSFELIQLVVALYWIIKVFLFVFIFQITMCVIHFSEYRNNDDERDFYKIKDRVTSWKSNFTSIKYLEA